MRAHHYIWVNYLRKWASIDTHRPLYSSRHHINRPLEVEVHIVGWATN